MSNTTSNPDKKINPSNTSSDNATHSNDTDMSTVSVPESNGTNASNGNVDANQNGKTDSCRDEVEQSAETQVIEKLKDEDFPKDFTDADKESIKEIASDSSVSEPKSYASILVEQIIDAKETFNRSLGSLFTSAFTAGLEIGISLFMILSAFALLNELLPSQYAIVLSSLLYPIGFIIVVIGQSLLFTEQTSLLSLPVLNGIEPLRRLLRLWGIVIAGNIVGGCLFAALMIGLGLNMQLFAVADIDAYAQHVLGFKWWVIFGSAVLAGWMMGVTAWLMTSARDTISRIVLVTLITGSIGFLGLHHSIVGNIEVFSALMYGNTVSLSNYLIFLVVVLAGNTVGGVVFVGVLKNRTFLFDIAKVKQENADDKNNKIA